MYLPLLCGMSLNGRYSVQLHATTSAATPVRYHRRRSRAIQARERPTARAAARGGTPYDRCSLWHSSTNHSSNKSFRWRIILDEGLCSRPRRAQNPTRARWYGSVEPASCRPSPRACLLWHRTSPRVTDSAAGPATSSSSGRRSRVTSAVIATSVVPYSRASLTRTANPRAPHATPAGIYSTASGTLRARLWWGDAACLAPRAPCSSCSATRLLLAEPTTRAAGSRPIKASF